MIRSLLLRGLLTGMIAGAVAGAFAFAVGEPDMDRAIALEEASAAAAQDGGAAVQPALPSAPPVGRPVQRLGLFVATGLYGLATGGLFALAFAAVRGRAGSHSDSATAIGLGAVLSVAVVLVPFVKYPANPPAVGDPATIGSRTVLYLLMVAISLLAALAAWRVARAAASTATAVSGPVVAAGAYLVIVAAAMAVLPEARGAPPSFPAELLWDFRVAALGTQLTLWSTLSVVFAVSLEHANPARRTRAPRLG
jgi:hypothetical protein